MNVDEDTLRAMLASRGPAQPPADLVDRIMTGIPLTPTSTSWIDRWIRVAWPIALLSAAAAAALVVAIPPQRTPAPRDPVATLTMDRVVDMGRLLALSR